MKFILFVFNLSDQVRHVLNKVLTTLLSVSFELVAKFGTCTVVRVNGTLVEAKVCTFAPWIYATRVPFTLTTVQVLNLAITNTKRLQCTYSNKLKNSWNTLFLKQHQRHGKLFCTVCVLENDVKRWLVWNCIAILIFEYFQRSRDVNESWAFSSVVDPDSLVRILIQHFEWIRIRIRIRIQFDWISNPIKSESNPDPDPNPQHCFLLNLEFCCMSVPICHYNIVHVWEGPECVPCVVYACPPCGVLVRARSVRAKAVSSRLSANLWGLIDCFRKGCLFANLWCLIGYFPKGCLFHQRWLNKFRCHKNLQYHPKFFYFHFW